MKRHVTIKLTKFSVVKGGIPQHETCRITSSWGQAKMVNFATLPLVYRKAKKVWVQLIARTDQILDLNIVGRVSTQMTLVTQALLFSQAPLSAIARAHLHDGIDGSGRRSERDRRVHEQLVHEGVGQEGKAGRQWRHDQVDGVRLGGDAREFVEEHLQERSWQRQKWVFLQQVSWRTCRETVAIFKISKKTPVVCSCRWNGHQLTNVASDDRADVNFTRRRKW